MSIEYRKTARKGSTRPHQKAPLSSCATRKQPSPPAKDTRNAYAEIPEVYSSPPAVLLTTDEVCTFLHMGKTNVSRLIHQHRLPVYKIGGVNRFDPREVWQWVQRWRQRSSL